MKFDEFLSTTQSWPIIESKNLVAYGYEKRLLALQLSRWVAQGRLLQLRRGLYMLREPYRRADPSAEYVANVLRRPSFVSFESALSFHGMIPELTPLLRSVTTKRPGLFSTELGDFDYRHVASGRFFGYQEYPTAGGSALIATPERSLLDLFYFLKGPIEEARLHELRLQHLDELDLALMDQWAARYENRRVERAGVLLRRVAQREQSALETL